MSKIIKGLKKIEKKIFKFTKKVFKKVASSTIGKVILAAVAIYTGGVLLGAWGSGGPLSGLFGAWGGGAAATTAATASTGTTVAAAEGLTAAGMAEAAAAPLVTEGTLAAATNAGLTSTFGAVAGTAAPTVAASSGVLSSIGAGIKAAGTWAEANPLLASTALKGVASALSPDEEDMLRLQEDARRRRFSSLDNVGDIDLGIAPRAHQILKDPSGTPWHERLRKAGGG